MRELGLSPKETRYLSGAIRFSFHGFSATLIWQTRASGPVLAVAWLASILALTKCDVKRST